jgi:hypothetical protein
MLAVLAASCSGGSNKVPDECLVKSSSGPVVCSNDAVCGSGAQCDTAMSPSTCVKTACVPNGAPCSTNEQCKGGMCALAATGGDAGKGGDAGMAAVKSGTCGAAAGEGGAGDAGTSNACSGKMNYVFDDPNTLPNGFTLAACGAYAAVEKMVETDASRASQFITPLAGQILPVSMPYKFTWSAATFPDAPAPGMDANKANGNGYVVQFIDVNTSKELLRLHTINMDYTPDDAAWAKLTAAANMPNPPGLQLKITAAFFVDNTIPAGTNPVIGTQPRLVQLDPGM